MVLLFTYLQARDAARVKVHLCPCHPSTIIIRNIKDWIVFILFWSLLYLVFVINPSRSHFDYSFVVHFLSPLGYTSTFVTEEYLYSEVEASCNNLYHAEDIWLVTFLRTFGGGRPPTGYNWVEVIYTPPTGHLKVWEPRQHTKTCYRYFLVLKHPSA
jgi:hypothetical protein